MECVIKDKSSPWATSVRWALALHIWELHFVWWAALTHSQGSKAGNIWGSLPFPFLFKFPAEGHFQPTWFFFLAKLVQTLVGQGFISFLSMFFEMYPFRIPRIWNLSLAFTPPPAMSKRTESGELEESSNEPYVELWVPPSLHLWCTLWVGGRWLASFQ